MLNKKAIAIEELAGILFFILVSAVLVLIFYGCSISNAKQGYEQLQFSKKQLQVDNELNIFLQMQVNPETKMSEALTQEVKEYFSLGIATEDDQKKFKKDIAELTITYVPRDTRFIILTPEGFCCLYDSYRNYVFRQIGYEDTAESVVKLHIPFGPDEYEAVPVAFQKP